MKKKKIYNLLIIFVLTMAIIQAPLFYYYTFGIFVFFYCNPLFDNWSWINILVVDCCFEKQKL